MLKFAQISNAKYHEKQINYYTKQVDSMVRDDDPMIPLAFGALAKRSNREGSRFSVEEWRILSMGYNPFETDWHKCQINNNPVLLGTDLLPLPDSAQTTKSAERRESLEAVLSVDSSVSIWIAAQEVSVQEKVMRAQVKIIEDKILPMLRTYAMYEKDNRRLFAEDLSFVSIMSHIENRSVEPMGHFHLNIKNSVLGQDGKFYALESSELFKNVAFIEAVFQMEFAQYLKKEFPRITLDTVDTKPDRWNEHLDPEQKNVFGLRIAGVPDAVVAHFATRSSEIARDMEDKGLTGHKAQNMAQAYTRSQKTDLSASALRAEWHKEMQEQFGYTPEMANRLAELNRPNKAPMTDDELVSSFHRRQNAVFFTETQFKAHVFKQLMLSRNSDECVARADAIFKRQAVVMLAHGREDFYKEIEAANDPLVRKALQTKLSTEVRYTSRYYYDMERAMVASYEARRDETGFVLPHAQMVRALDDWQQAKRSTVPGYRMTEGQTKSFLAMTTGKGAITNISGFAGTGKTTVVEVAVKEFHKAGFRVIGTATGTQAVSVLMKDSGIENGWNTTELLLRLSRNGAKPPTLQLTSKDIIVLDEAGMTSSLEFCELTRHIERAGARMICLGDKNQLQAVGPSAIYAEMTKRFGHTEITEIQRQNEHWAREMVLDSSTGKSMEAILALHKHGGIDICATTQERIQRIAEAYVGDKSRPQDKFIVASLNEDADRINNEVQRQLIASGQLNVKLANADVVDRDGISRRFHVGERIVFTKNTKSDDLFDSIKAHNSQTGEIKNIIYKKGKLAAIFIHLDNTPADKVISVGPEKARYLKLGSAITTYKSQGSTKVNSYLFGSTMLNDLHNFYVQLSRHKSSTKLFLSKDQVEEIAKDRRLITPSPKQQKWAQDLIKADHASGHIDENEHKKLLSQIETFQGCREYLNTHSRSYIASSTSGRQQVMESEVLRDFVGVFESMGKSNYNRTTFDMEVLSGPLTESLEEFQFKRRAARTSVSMERVDNTKLANDQAKLTPFAYSVLNPPAGQKLTPDEPDSLLKATAKLKRSAAHGMTMMI